MIIDKANFDFDSFKSQVDLILNKCNDTKFNIINILTPVNETPTLNQLLFEAFDKIQEIKKDNKNELSSLPFIGKFIKPSKSKIEEEKQIKNEKIQKVIKKTFNLIKDIKEKSVNAQIQFVNIKEDLNASILDLKNRYIFLQNITNQHNDKNIHNLNKLSVMIKANIDLLEENIKNINLGNDCCKYNIQQLNDFIKKYDNQSENNLFLKQDF